MLEVEFDRDVEIVVNNNIEVTTSNMNVAIVEDTNDIEVTVNRQEYVITGDEIYIPKRFEDAPTWMQNLITQVVDTSISAQIQDLNGISQSLESMIDAMEVAKNTYEMSIISSNDIDERINTAVTTLNSAMNTADATVLEVAQTRVTPEEASAITIDVISAQLGSTTAGTIGASVSELQTAIANEEEARSTSLEILTSSIEGAFDANATAMNYLNTYVGVDDRGGPTRTGLLADVEILQKQNDGVIETTTGTYDVMINPENPNLAQLVTTSEPYATWRALDTTGISNRLAHIGDVYVKYSDTANGAKEYIASYKFIRTVVDETSPYATDSDGFTWALVIDQAAQDAYEQALNAFDLADSKRRVYIGNTIPTIMDSGDLWIPSANTGSFIAGEIYKYNGTSWIIATKYSADIESVRENLQGQIDGKVDTYYQGTVPAGMTALNNGDYWYCTADISTYKKGKVYKYVHATTSWVETADVSRYAFDTADGKASIFTSTAQPTAYKINDMLIVTGSFNNGTTTFSDGVVLSSNATRTAGFVAADWVKKINDTEDLDLFVSSVYNPAVLGLQSQIDGKIENWFTLSTNDPKASWVDADTRLKHNGDLWYQTDTKISYYYTSSTHTWNILDDAKAIQALTNAATAQTAANNAQTSANTANSLLADIASDSKFTPSEKSLVKNEWDSIQSEYTKNLAQGTSYSVSTAAYTTAYNALNTYITPLLASLTTTSDVVGTTFRATFKAYYDANVDLLNAISNKINLIADGKITSYYMATFSAVQAMSAAWTVSEKTSNIGDLAVVHNDTTVDNNGTWRWDGANWVTTRDKKLVALASQVTALSTDLQSGDGTWADADSTLTNSLTTTINDKTATVESKFAYNSVIGINGIYKKSGFGLTTNYVSGSGTEVDPYVSEFWIDASRFKFTNSNVTGSVSPFTIDATGDTPQITFNGNVSFSNVSNVPSFDSGSNNLLTNSAPKLGDETYGWEVTWYTTNIVPIAVAAGFDSWRPTGAGSVYTRFYENPTVGTVFDIGQSNNIPVVAGKRYEISALLSSHRCTSKCSLAFYNSAGTYISEIGAGLGNDVGYSGDLSNWVRQGGFVTVPAGVAMARFYVRSTVTGTDPYCFVAQAYMGEVSTDRTEFSKWSEGTSASFSSDVLAQKIGYLSYADMVTAATNGKTIINGGYLRTNLIQAGAITANQINTAGLIAENISASTISGKTITGGTITGNTISGNTISGGTVTGTSIIGGSISGTTGTFSGEMTVGKFGDANMTISNGIAYIPIIDFGSIALSTSGIYNGFLKYVETTGPLLRSTCSFQITGVGSVGAGEELFLSYSVNNGGTWVQFASFISTSRSFTTVFSASGVSAVANSRIRIRIASQSGSFHGSIIVSNFS